MTARDLVMSAAGNSGSSKTYVEDVFSTYLYTGNGSTQTINNGIDLAGKGGMVWIKDRTSAYAANIVDTDRGYQYTIAPSATNAQINRTTTYVTSFNSNGFSLSSGTGVNTNADNLVSWTFRKAPKFFDVVTFTAPSSGTLVVNHSLGVVPGMFVVKSTSAADGWMVWHRSLATGNYLMLNTTEAAGSTYGFTNVTSSSFTIDTSKNTAVGETYVAYLFAHDTTADGMIQCGSFTTDGSGNATVNLGWEPQYVMIKSSSSDDGMGWYVFDNMRGFTASGPSFYLKPNSSGSEGQSGSAKVTSTGFSIPMAASTTYIYMAIRRPMKVPTDGTKVFKPVLGVNCAAGGVMYNTGFPVDMVFEGWRNGTASNATTTDRLRGNYTYLKTSATSAETADGGYRAFDSNSGLKYNIAYNGSSASNNLVGWNFARAPGFFDVVCYTGTGVARTVDHNLGVAPELMIVKSRSSAFGWIVYSAPTGASSFLQLQTTDAVSSGGYWNSGTSPTSTQFSLGGFAAVNNSGNNFVAYLFASCPGVSKVGSYTGNGSSQTINCGFTNGARFVLIKIATGSTNGWYVFDTARGITSSFDPSLQLQSTIAEDTTSNWLTPDSTGFTVSTPAGAINGVGYTYIYLAIA